MIYHLLKNILFSLKISFLVGITVIIQPLSFGQSNNSTTPYIRNYLPDEFKAYPHNWAVIQDNRGIVYAGNRDGILEFDGVNWRLIETQSLVRSFAIDQNGRIYVGLKGDFGYLKANKKGTTEFISLKEQLLNEYREINDVWKIHIIKDQIFFQTFDEIFIYKDEVIKIITPQNKFHLSFKVNNQLIIREWKKGLFYYLGDSLQYIPGSGLFANERVYAMLPFDTNEILIGTRTQGIFIFNTKNQSFSKPDKFSLVNKFLENAPLYSGIMVNKNLFGFGTLNNGIIVFNKDGDILSRYSTKNGLLGNEIFHLYTNDSGQIWVAMSNGISFIENNTPFTIYSGKNGLKGLISSLSYFKGDLYVATTQSLYKKGKNNQFNSIKGIEGQNFQIYEANNKLLLAHNPGVFEIKNKKATLLSGTKNKRTFIFSSIKSNPNSLLVGSDGILLLEFKQDKWNFKHQIKGFSKPVIELVEDQNNNYWVFTNPYLYRLKMNSALDSVIFEEHCNTKHGLPSDYGRPFILKSGELVIGTEKGIYSYNSATNRFDPHPNFNALKGRITALKQGANDLIWFEEKIKNGKNEKGLLFPVKHNEEVKTYKTYKKPFLKFNDHYIISKEAILPISDSLVYVGTSTGLLAFKPYINIDYNKSYQTFIRQVYNDNELLFDGNNKLDANGITLTYQQNNLTFYYTSSFYEDANKNLYSYRLKGRDKKWSDWTSSYKKEYTNLHEGDYTFEVRSRNVYEIEGSLASYPFIIQPPWYRSNLAFILYGVFSVIFIWGIVRLNTNRLIKEKLKLESLVDKRTSEIQSQAEEIASQNQILTEQKIALEKSFENLKLLNIIGKDITQSLSITTIVNTVYEKINSLMDVTEFGISVYDEEAEEITYKNYFLNGEIIPEVKVSTKRVDRIGVYSIVYGKEIWLNNVKENYKNYVKNLEDYEEGELLNSLICLPLKSGKEKIGTLSVQSEKLNAYSEYHVNLLRNIATYTAAAIENAKSYEKILALDQFKESMTSMIVHDLKTPLNTIIGLSTEDPTIRKIQLVHQSGLQMLNLVSNILDVYKYESTKISLSKDTHSIASLIQSAFKQVQFLIEEKNVFLINKCNPRHTAVADFDLINRVLVNLLSNAIKYTPVMGKVTITTTETDKKLVEIRVSDTGQGIPKDKLNLVFDKFKQIKAKKSGVTASTGLGLTFCKMVIEAHQGKIGVDSTLGQGADFFFTLPIGNPLVQEETIAENTSPESYTDIKLNHSDKIALKKILAQLESQEIYYYSDIEEILSKVDFKQSANLTLWHKFLRKAMIQTSKELYSELIHMAKDINHKSNP